MKKFNGFESHLLEQGLSMVLDSMKNDILRIESQGKMPIMTVSYVDMIGKETLERLKSLTKKSK